MAGIISLCRSWNPNKLRLSQIKLAGFKSFVDPTHISFPGQIVGVVGPNGCGKSNVIDALRWVLGESKASALRGETMQDVIFNGSSKRKPVSRASVELIFDNSLGKAAGQWSSYAEISIKRVLQREGDSSYHINNQHVRRKDITDIFLGTGHDLAHHRGQAGRVAHLPGGSCGRFKISRTPPRNGVAPGRHARQSAACQ
jgi:chromosome segregation ATPase